MLFSGRLPAATRCKGRCSVGVIPLHRALLHSFPPFTDPSPLDSYRWLYAWGRAPRQRERYVREKDSTGKESGRRRTKGLSAALRTLRRRCQSAGVDVPSSEASSLPQGREPLPCGSQRTHGRALPLPILGSPVEDQSRLPPQGADGAYDPAGNLARQSGWAMGQGGPPSS